MKKVKLLCFALVLSLSATVAIAQPSGLQPASTLMTEQEMSNQNPSSWSENMKKAVFDAMNVGLGVAVSPPTMYGGSHPESTRIANTLTASLSSSQKTSFVQLWKDMKAAASAGSSQSSLPPSANQVSRPAPSTPRPSANQVPRLEPAPAPSTPKSSVGTKPSCSGLKYADFWFVLGFCKQ